MKKVVDVKNINFRSFARIWFSLSTDIVGGDDKLTVIHLTWLLHSQHPPENESGL